MLHDVSLEVGAAEIVAVIGPNGAGKSTLLKAIYGLARVRAGTVHYNGADVTRSSAHELTELGLNFVPQTDNVFPSLSIAENLAVGAGVLPRSEPPCGARTYPLALSAAAGAAASARRHALRRAAQARRPRTRTRHRAAPVATG